MSNNRRLARAIIPPVPDYCDVGPYEAVVEHHPWLYCWHCGERLRWGETPTGAPLYACLRCKRVCDVRRVA